MPVSSTGMTPFVVQVILVKQMFVQLYVLPTRNTENIKYEDYKEEIERVCNIS